MVNRPHSVHVRDERRCLRFGKPWFLKSNCLKSKWHARFYTVILVHYLFGGNSFPGVHARCRVESILPASTCPVSYVEDLASLLRLIWRPASRLQLMSRLFQAEPLNLVLEPAKRRPLPLFLEHVVWKASMRQATHDSIQFVDGRSQQLY